MKHMSQTTVSASRLAAALMVTALLVLPEVALAAPWDDTAQKILEIFTGGLSRTVAIVAVIGCGIMALAGKLQWSWAINIVLGIVLIFGGATIVDYFISAIA
jgi:type IV secretion system protein VirB2